MLRHSKFKNTTASPFPSEGSLRLPDASVINSLPSDATAIAASKVRFRRAQTAAVRVVYAARGWRPTTACRAAGPCVWLAWPGTRGGAAPARSARKTEHRGALLTSARCALRDRTLLP